MTNAKQQGNIILGVFHSNTLMIQFKSLLLG